MWRKPVYGGGGGNNDVLHPGWSLAGHMMTRKTLPPGLESIGYMVYP